MHSSWVADRVTERQAEWEYTIQAVAKHTKTLQEAAEIFSKHNKVDVNAVISGLNHSVAALHEDKNAKEIVNRPLLFTYMNVDTHTPFKGYDIERYYD